MYTALPPTSYQSKNTPKQHFHLLPIKVKIHLYNALITPHFDCADVVSGGCGKTNCKKLQLALNFAAKSITGNRKHDTATNSLQKLKFLNLQQTQHT
jgi:hypothetical protein